MSLQVLGPTPYFWQWDTGRKLEVTDTSCGEVHFCNGTGDCALVVKIQTQDDGTRVVDVPNILLQTAKPIRAWLFQRHDNGAKTRVQYTIQVLARSRPDSYVYEETEVLSYAHLDRRLTDLEGEGIAQAVAAYLEENPVEAGATAAEAAQIQQNKTDIEALTADKLDAEKLPEAVNDALAQAKESGVFDGEPGQPGAPGQDYQLTPEDKTEIAEMAAGLVEVPEAPEVSMKPLTFTGAVNATYDGSEAVEVEIPEGGGSGEKPWRKIAEYTFEEEVQSDVWMFVNEDMDGNSLDLLELMTFLELPSPVAKIGNMYYMADGYGKAPNRNYALSATEVYSGRIISFHSEAIGFENNLPMYIRTTCSQDGLGSGTPAKTTAIKAGRLMDGCGLYILKGTPAGSKYTVWGIDR